MFNNIKISSSLIFIFFIFAILQIGSSSLGFYRAKDSANDFQEIVALNKQRELLAQAKESLLRARIESNKTVIMTMVLRTDFANQLMTLSKNDLKTAEEHFDEFLSLPILSKEAEALSNEVKIHSSALIQLLKQQLLALQNDGKNGYINIDVQPYQVALDEAVNNYSNYIQQLVIDKNDENNHEFKIATIQLIIELTLIIFIVGCSLFWLKNVIITPLTKLLNYFLHITNGDLTEKVPTLGQNEIGKLFDYFAQMQHSLITTVSTVRESTHTIVEGIEHLALGNDDLSARTEQQASSLEETAASMEQLTATVKLNADNARNASLLSNSTAQAAIKGGEVSKTVVSTMQDISESSNKIGAITNVIDSIAFQTNILALNAAVEAARAGEQGRGFAVVAGEVRNLAQRSAQAAREIKQLIADASERVHIGSELVINSGKTMQEIVQSINEVNTIIASISSASDEQSRGIELVSQAVTEMDNVTQQNSGLVNSLAASAREIENQVAALTKAVSTFKLD